MQMTETKRWRFKGPEMEGAIARWYARVRGSQSQLEAYRKQASQLTAGLLPGALGQPHVSVIEISARALSLHLGPVSLFVGVVLGPGGADGLPEAYGRTDRQQKGEGRGYSQHLAVFADEFVEPVGGGRRAGFNGLILQESLEVAG